MSKSRFSSLELDGGARGPVRKTPRPGQDGSPARQGHEPRDAAYYLRQAWRLEREGDQEQALREYSAALGEEPLNHEAWIGQIRMLLEMEEYPEARMWADKALERFPDNPRLLSVKAMALHRMGHTQEARALSDAALQQKGESDLVWLSRGEIMLAQGPEAAQRCFDQAMHQVAEEEKVAAINRQIGSAYFRAKRLSQAITPLKRACAADPGSPWGWYLLGQAQQAAGLTGEAQESFKQAGNLSPLNQKYRLAYAVLARGLPLTTRLKNLFRRIREK